MTDSPSVEQLKYALDRVLPDDEEMTTEEKAEFLAEHPEALKRALRDAGFGKARPADIARGFYSGGESQTTTVSPAIAKAVRKRFPSQPDVEVRDPSDSPSLGIHYGGKVDSPAATEGGSYFPESD